jgi:hypothetical protein
VNGKLAILGLLTLDDQALIRLKEFVLRLRRFVPKKQLLASWATLADVFLYRFLPLPLGFEDEFNRIAQRSVSPFVFSYVVSVAFYFLACVGYGNRKSAVPHNRQIDYIVSDEAGFGGAQVVLL